MKQFIVVAMAVLMMGAVVTNAYATAVTETGDTRAVPVSAYGVTSGGSVVAIQVDSNGKIVTSGGTSSDLSPWLTDTGNVYLETSTLNVGIGTLTPSGKLGVIGDVTITGTVTSTGGVFATVLTAAQPNVTSLGTLSTLNVTGNTGIGTTSPNAALGVAGDASVTGNMHANTITIGDGIEPCKFSSSPGDVGIADSLSVSVDLTVARNVSITGGLTISNVVSSSGAVYYATINPTGGVERSATYFSGGGSGSGTVNSGAENAMAYFSAAGTAVSGNTDVLASFRGLTISDVLTANGAVFLGPNSFEATVEADGDATYAFYVTDAATTKVMDLSEIGVTFGVPLLSNVGIGMASPQAVLDLSPAAVSATTEIVRIRNVSQNDVLHVDIKGNVGIGSVSPQAVLDLSPSAKMTTTPIFLSRTLSAVETMRILTNGRIKLQSDGSTIPSGATQPANVGAGELWIDTDTQGLCIGT